jgi:hypothetical protein
MLTVFGSEKDINKAFEVNDMYLQSIKAKLKVLE